MQAYEFNATIQDGIIHIPEQLADENLSWVKVILLADSVKKTADSRKGKFTAMRLKTKGIDISNRAARLSEIQSVTKNINVDLTNFHFNRDEAHER